MIRSLRRGVSLVALIFGLLVVGALAVRALAQHQTAEALAIRTPNGIDEERFVRIGGADQWITIRGQDRRNPLLLILHGGPGSPLSYLQRQFEPMERHYVVVQWDQPGGGKTLARNGGLVDPRIDMARLVADGIALSQYLRGRLHHDKIILVGHSFGSILGAKMVQARPDLYAAFVGTGMAGRTQLEWQRWAYADLLAQTQGAGDAKGFAEMHDGVGPPPWADDSPQIMHLAHAARPYLPPSLGYFDHLRILLATPHWSLSDILAVPKGMAGMLHAAVWKPEARDAYLAGPIAFTTPFLVIQGGDDKTTPVVLAHPWFERVQAPAKAFVVIPGQGHEALSWDNAAFTQALDANLPPLLKTPVAQP